MMTLKQSGNDDASLKRKSGLVERGMKIKRIFKRVKERWNKKFGMS